MLVCQLFSSVYQKHSEEEVGSHVSTVSRFTKARRCSVLLSVERAELAHFPSFLRFTWAKQSYPSIYSLDV